MYGTVQCTVHQKLSFAVGFVKMAVLGSQLFAVCGRALLCRLHFGATSCFQGTCWSLLYRVHFFRNVPRRATARNVPGRYTLVATSYTLFATYADAADAASPPSTKAIAGFFFESFNCHDHTREILTSARKHNPKQQTPCSTATLLTTTIQKMTAAVKAVGLTASFQS